MWCNGKNFYKTKIALWMVSETVESYTILTWDWLVFLFPFLRWLLKKKWVHHKTYFDHWGPSLKLISYLHNIGTYANDVEVINKIYLRNCLTSNNSRDIDYDICFSDSICGLNLKVINLLGILSLCAAPFLFETF